MGDIFQYPQIFTSHPYVPTSSCPKQPGCMDREKEIGSQIEREVKGIPLILGEGWALSSREV